MTIPSHLKRILEAAILAPSGDNCQPWRFNIQNDAIQIFNLPDKDTSLFNFQQTASLVAHGALIENIAIASSTQGYRARFDLLPDKAAPNLVANVRLERGEVERDSLYPFLAARGTNRKRYGGVPLAEAERKALTAVAQEREGGSLRLLESGAEKKAVAQVIGLNDRLVFENRQLHAFLFDHIRWSDQEAEATRDGLDVKTLELAPPDSLAFRLFRNWSLLPVLNRFGVSRIIGNNAVKLALSGGALGAVSVNGRSEVDFLNGGRTVQRVWLEATRCGLSFQPMTGIVFLMNRVLAGATEGFSPSHLEQIRQAHGKLKNAFGINDETVVMLFRVGRSAPPSTRSLRVPVERLVDA